MFSLHELPTSVLINEVEYGIDISFDNIIRIQEILMGDEEQGVRLYKVIRLLFEGELGFPPQQQIEAFEMAYEALVFMKEPEIVEYDLKGNPMPKAKSDDESSGADYCIVRDMEYIYPSFLQDYGIDLLREKGNMHWWTFRTLLKGLSTETKFKQVLDIRSRTLEGVKGKELEALREAKKMYALKPYREAVQHEGD